MLATSRPALAPEQDLRQGLDDLRCDVLSGFPTLLIIGSWLWFAFAIIKGSIPGPDDAVVVIALAAAYGVYRLRERYYEAACWLFLLSSVVIIGLIMLGHPSALVMVAGVTVVVAANALLSARAALLSGALAWASTIIIWHARAGPISLTGDALAILWLYLLVTVASWLALRPLRMAVAWALTGWTHAHEALDEVQRRRGELEQTFVQLDDGDVAPSPACGPVHSPFELGHLSPRTIGRGHGDRSVQGNAQTADPGDRGNPAGLWDLMETRASSYEPPHDSLRVQNNQTFYN